MLNAQYARNDALQISKINTDAAIYCMKQRLAVRKIEKVLKLSCQTYMRGGAGTNIARKRGKQTNGIMKHEGKQHFR